MKHPSVTVQLTVTSFYPSPVGGGLLIGTECGSTSIYRVRIGSEIASREPRPAEQWRVSGTWVVDETHGRQIQADVALPLIPSGEAVIRWIASNPTIAGVGTATATKLWKQHRNDLYRILRSGDGETLARTVGPIAAQAIVSEFAMMAEEVDVLEHFDQHGIDAPTAIAACRLWGAGAISKLEEDPYSLNLLQPWTKVDERALRMGVTREDSRRLIAAVGEVVARRYRGHGRGIGGHTAAQEGEVVAALRQVLGRSSAELAERAFSLAAEAGELIEYKGLWQGRGPYMMERAIERELRVRLTPRMRPPPDVAESIRQVESELGIELDCAQVAAVEGAVLNRFAVIDGAAGTGKSLVTRAIMRSVHASGHAYTQVALSGRAAKRLREATGHEALTIHRFLKELANGVRKLAPGTLLIDEASMVSTPDLWQIVSWATPEIDIVLVGDPGQLPPIGAGNPLSAAVSCPALPRKTLTVIHRQSGPSPIPQVAQAIRSGDVPRLPEFNRANTAPEGVFAVSCSSADVPNRVLEVFESFVGSPASGADRVAIRQLHAARAQILGMTTQGPAGVKALSEAVEARWMSGQPPIPGWGLAEGSKILWTRNSYDHPIGGTGPDGEPIKADIMNGSLGIVQRATANGASVLFDDENSTKAEIRAHDLNRVIRGWAVTVHKAQGSAFDRVIIPVVRSRLLDRQLLYTAITRARKAVVLIGDPHLIRVAVQGATRSSLRRQCLLA